MAAGERVLLLGLQDQDKKQYNMCIGNIDSRNGKRSKYIVALLDGTKVSVKKHNMFFMEQAARHFTAPKEQLAPLNAVAAVQNGPHGRMVVAAQPIPAHTVLKTDIVTVVLPDEQFKQIEKEFLSFLSKNLLSLMQAPPGHRQRLKLESNYSPTVPFVGAFFAQASKLPAIVKLMDYDVFSPDELTFEWRRGCGQDLLWYEFWRQKLEGEYTAEQVCGGWAFVKNFAWPELDGTTLVFGEFMSIFNCPQARWDDYEEVMAGENAAYDKHVGKHLTQVVFFNFDKDMQTQLVYFVKDVAQSEEIVMDYGPFYVSNLWNTVLRIKFLKSDALAVAWMNVFCSIAKNVNADVAHHLMDYFRSVIKRPDAHVAPPAVVPQAPPLCAHKACGKPMQNPKRCCQCKVVLYCSKECQVAAWKAGHKRECVKGEA